jgi:hypothetical protein
MYNSIRSFNSSRRRGIRIFTPDKGQLCENVTRSGHRPLAMEFAVGFAPRRGNRLWDRMHKRLLRFGKRAADTICRLKLTRRRHTHKPNEHMNTKTPEYWSSDPNAHGIRIELSPEGSLCYRLISSLLPNSRTKGSGNTFD